MNLQRGATARMSASEPLGRFQVASKFDQRSTIPQGQEKYAAPSRRRDLGVGVYRQQRSLPTRLSPQHCPCAQATRILFHRGRGSLRSCGRPACRDASVQGTDAGRAVHPGHSICACPRGSLPVEPRE